MPRKKSAAKIAEEKKNAALAELVTKKANSSENPLPVDIEELKRELREEELAEEEKSDDNEEEEDDYGELLTEDIENGLNDVLKAIKTGDKRLFDSNVKFFNDDDNLGDENKVKKSKPLFLKDYHRKALLDGFENDNELQSIDGEKPYAFQQKEDRENLIKEMHNAISSDEENDNDDDDFLIRKEKKTEISDKSIPIVTLPDPEENGEKFLEAFMENHAWLPNKGEEVTMQDEDDPEFDAAAEKFENAYNFRFEDPKSTEIISYARSQATIRREKMNSRKRDRLKKQEEKTKEKEEIKDELKKKKQKKVNLVVDRIKEIKEAVGDEVSEEKILQIFGNSLMKEDFDDEEWDLKMSQFFDDEYYGKDDESLAKPTWDDEIMNDFNGKESEEDEEVEEVEEEESEEAREEEKQTGEEEGVEKGEKGKEQSHKSKKKEQKFNKKQEKNKIKDVAEKLVESKTLDILGEVEEERGRDKEKKYTFKYREVSPESFGLTYNEIFQANDTDLNELIGLKKLAPYRPHDKMAKDKRKITKSRNMREWRKRTFGSENGVSESTDLDIKIPSIVFDNSSNHQENSKRKIRKTKKKFKSKK
jgi:protein KRI1